VLIYFSRVRGLGGSDFSFQTPSERNLLLKSASVVISDDGLGEGSIETTTTLPQLQLSYYTVVARGLMPPPYSKRSSSSSGFENRSCRSCSVKS